MDFSSLVLMERDKDTGLIVKELGSYAVVDGAEYIKSFYVAGEEVYIKFDTNKDVEEWEYSAVYDNIDYGIFEEEELQLEEVEDEYNPTFLIKFKYEDDHNYIADKLQLSTEVIREAMEKVFKDIQGKEEEYK